MTYSSLVDAEVVSDVGFVVLSEAVISLIIACEKRAPGSVAQFAPELMAGIREDLCLIREAWPDARISDRSLRSLDECLSFIIQAALAEAQRTAAPAH
ncbi:hypothetical protein [Methylobacterium segetis]|uniref:hypothetical protein n=1 Tax=Methylobacterium segetis TaxID=2488750 RepID=UPI0010484A82|nr:hypothetical protein [Methylobacterium segetis]